MYIVNIKKTQIQNYNCLTPRDTSIIQFPGALVRTVGFARVRLAYFLVLAKLGFDYDDFESK